MKVEGAPIGGPLHFFRSLSEESRAAFLKALPDEAVVDNWTRRIGAQTSTRRAVASPIRWMLRKYGTVSTSKGIKPLPQAVGPQLAAYRDVLPVADISPEKARKLRLPTTVDEVPANHWEALLTEVLHSEDDAFVGNTYVMLTRFEAAFPEDSLTRCRIGDAWGTRPDDEITVAGSLRRMSEEADAEITIAYLTRGEAADVPKTSLSDLAERRTVAPRRQDSVGAREKPGLEPLLPGPSCNRGVEGRLYPVRGSGAAQASDSGSEDVRRRGVEAHQDIGPCAHGGQRDR